MREQFSTKRLLVPLILAVLLLSACATVNIDWNALGPEGKAAWALSLYNAEYDAYLAEASNPALTESQKEVLRVKRRILVEYESIVSLYAQYVSEGQIPPATLESLLIEKMNTLLMFLSKER